VPTLLFESSNAPRIGLTYQGEVDMHSLKILAVLTAVFISPAAFAGDKHHGKHNSFKHIQVQLNRLAARTQALEDSAPNSNIDGRTYCSILDMQLMRAKPGSQTEETLNNVVRRVVRFENGVLTGDLLSKTLNDHSDTGTISHTANVPDINPLLATYLQMDSKIDITFDDGSTTNWHVSKDGSAIFGTKISNLVLRNGAISLGIVRNWTLIEIDPLESCDAEDQ
jgi:hypothetical protein